MREVLQLVILGRQESDIRARAREMLRELVGVVAHAPASRRLVEDDPQDCTPLPEAGRADSKSRPCDSG